MAQGLSVSDVVNVSINLSPLAVPSRSFAGCCVIGRSTVIDVNSRVRQYSTITQVATDFGTTAPEYLAAALFFSQNPQPSILYIGRWAQTASSGQLLGADLSATQQTSLLTTLQAITTGGMTISVDGTPHTLSNLNFSAISNLNGAATVLTTGLAAATAVWNASFGRFEITSHTSGTTSSVSYATDPGTGAPLATDLGLTQASGASSPVPGLAPESALTALQAIASTNGDIYAMMFTDAAVSGSVITDATFLQLATYVEAASPVRILGITTQEPGTLDPTSTTDLAHELDAANYSRTIIQYSSSSPYATASFFGRALTTDFTANNSVLTMKFKVEPGVKAEILNETQATAVKNKDCNVFVNFTNGAAIIQEGVMSDGTFFDERQGTDWLANQVQTDLFNLLYTSPTKIPQTDSGVHQLVTTVEHTMSGAVNNGLLAAGVWTSSLQFGQLSMNDNLPKGYYVYAPPVATQSQADREARKAPTIQVAAKLAGAVHSANVVINVNR